jgi:hypothetical protein
MRSCTCALSASREQRERITQSLRPGGYRFFSHGRHSSGAPAADLSLSALFREVTPR